MSRRSGSSLIPVAVFLAILFIVLPVSADNVTTAATTVASTATTTAVPTTTLTITQTTTVVPTTTVTTVQTTTAVPTTSPATTQTTAAPVNTTVRVTTRPSAVVTTVKPTIIATETATTGSVNVYSSPAGAGILIDGVYSGITPRTVSGVPAGNHILRLTLSGYYDYEGSIFVVPGESAQGYGTLQPMSQAVSAAPTQTVVVPVIVPVVTATPAPAEDPGLLGNSTVIAALLGAIAVVIGSAATIFTHVRPPKKE